MVPANGPSVARENVRPAGGFLVARRVLTLAPGVAGNAIWWQDGQVRAVGAAHELARRVPSRVRRYEYPGALVTPGFVDGHTHFVMWAIGRRQVRLAGAGSRSEALERVAAGVPVQGWILGHGWNANQWDEPPDRAALDEVQPLPVFLTSLDVHSAWVNSAALAAAGITRDTPDPPGGRIVRDAAGEPTGLLLERAVELVAPHVPRPGAAELVEAVRQAQGEAHRLGVTGIHDVEDPSALGAFQALDAAGELRLRVLFHPPVAQLPVLIRHGVRTGQGSPWLRLGGVKLFLDGSLGSRTAWMLQPYEDGRDSGMPVSTEGEARAAMQAAARAGLACVVHAIGDAAVRRALDLMAELPRVGLPHRIEHFQCVDPADLERAAELGVVSSMQPAHLLVDIPLAERHWGRRSRWAFAFRSLLDRGTVLAFGSDVPVASLDPREGIWAAMARVSASGDPPQGWYPEERLGFEEAVGAYTYGNALAAGVGERRGVLAPGQDADLVVWDVDPAIERGAAAAFREARALLTVVGGEVVMQG